MEYNCQREQLRISDYGRNVVKLIQYAKSIDDRTQRTKVAEAIVGVMAQVNPQSKDSAEYRHKLWNHLMMMADWDLDVDTPFPVARPDEEYLRPHTLNYKEHNMHYRHYGTTLEKMIARVAEMPEGEERNVLTAQIAHTMKRSYLTWNSDTVEDGVIVEQMSELSGGRLHPAADFQFNRDYAIEKAEVRPKGKGKKRKK
ncbi:MAG: hypothetical protein AUK63_1524 [bacterium P3]|nr:MAG: hypothetical protein AUK63_1524 [bacterium P3]KWW41080.1 MAG: hypothetical protein F083_1247 [bacterium F083]